MTSTRLLIQGQLHRPRYEAGSTLKCHVFAECTDKLLQGVDGPLPYEPNYMSPTARAAGGASASPTHGAPAVTIRSLEAQLVGTCTIDTNRIQIPKDTFGAAAGMPYRRVGADSASPIAEASRGSRWNVFGWGRGKSKPADEASEASSTQNAASKAMEVLASRTLTAGPTGGARSEDTHIFLCCPIIPIAADVKLRLGETCTAILRCDIPPNIPPSFQGYCARYTYVLHVVCEYDAYGKRQRAALRLPIRVDTPSAAVVAIRSPYVPLPTLVHGVGSGVSGDQQGGHGVVEEGFDYRIQHTYIVSNKAAFLKPSPHLAPPTADAIFSEEGGEGSGHSHAARSSTSLANAGASSNGTSRPPPRPYELGVPSPSINGPTRQSVLLRHGAFVDAQLGAEVYPLRILLWDTSVRLGDQIRGTFKCYYPTDASTTTNGGNRGLVCFRVVTTLEVIEAAPRSYFRAGSVIPKENHDDAGFVVAHCSTLEEVEHYVTYSTAQTPFTMGINGPRSQQTLRTDIVSNQWRLRFVVYFCSANALADAAASRSEHGSIVPIVERLQEVVVPLTVLPPAQSTRLGPMVSGESATEC